MVSIRARTALALLDHRSWIERKESNELPQKTNVKCRRCGEIIEGRVDLDNDLSLNDEGNGYIVRKGLIGGNRCFQQIEVELNFDSSRQLIEKTITGGTFVE